MTAHESHADWNLVGHTWAVRALTRNIAADRVAHAYLFTGPHAIGKTTLARALAQTLECTGAHHPCGECPSCQKIARDKHPDVQIIEGVPVGYKLDEKSPPPPPRANDWERRILKIDQIRAIQHDVARAPFEGRWKIIILRRFEEANEEAANAFLKTLEEPPRHTRLILTARDASLLLPTIASRCQVFALRPLAPTDIETALVACWQVDKENARLLAHLSSGRLGWAVRAATNPSILEKRRAGLDILDEILREGRAERIAHADILVKKSDELPEMLELWLGWWRDVLLAHTHRNEDARLTNIDRLALLQNHVERFSVEQIAGALKSVRATARYLSQNVNARLAMEVLLLNLPS
ncbi:MAG: DNA polymerase III subunit delta' [Chloroflexi bacterium]|nr:DNA polymerase III subunit delta' [Chloroflexota bacterium]